MGVCQNAPKAVLAYSSVSQMGLMTLIIGLIMTDASLAPVLMPVAALFAVHHGLAKGALFLSVTARGPSMFYLFITALPALSLIGLPFSSGASAKLAFKEGLPGPDSGVAGAELLPLALSLAAVVTTLLMARFFWCLWQQPPSDSPDRALVGWWLLAVVFSLGVFWWLPNILVEPLQVGATLADAWDLIYPVLLAGILIMVIVRFVARTPQVPPGDILLVISTFLGWNYRNLSKRAETLRVVVSHRIASASHWYRCQMTGRAAPERLEKALRRHGAWVFLMVTGVLVLLMQN